MKIVSIPIGYGISCDILYGRSGVEVRVYVEGKAKNYMAESMLEVP